MPPNKLYPISDVQKQFWLLDQQGKASAYLIVSAFECHGLDIERFISAVKSVLTQYAVFSGRFENTAQGVFHSRANTEPELIKDSCINDQAAMQLLREKAFQALNLESGPLVRLHINTVANSNRAFVALVVHHIVIDLRSKELLALKISQAYEAPDISAADGSGNNFREAVEWQQHWLETEQAEKAKRYWQQKLSDIDRQLVLANHADSSSELSYFEIPWELSGPTQRELKRYCKAHSTDEFIVLLCVYQYLLSRFSGQTCFAVGVPLSNRRQPSFQQTMGCFVNTLPIRIELSEVRHFSDLLKQTRKALLEAHRVQELPLAQIIQSLAKKGAQRELFNVGFTFEPPMQLSLKEADVQAIHLEGVAAQLDGFLRLWESEGRLQGQLECDGGFWNRVTARRFIAVFDHFIEQLVSADDDCLENYSLLTLSDREKLETLNATQTDFARDDFADLTLLKLFQQQVELSPEATALVAGERSLSYSEFERESNRCARLLQDQGVKKGDVVAIYTPRSLEMMIAIYGVIKAGAAYMPVDIDLPAERIAQMCQTAGVRFCCVFEEQPFFGDDVTQLSIGGTAWKSLTSEFTPVSVLPDDPAYVIFTSGSTGTPKGVVNSHRGIVNRLLWMQDYFELQAQERVLQKTPYSFDVSVWELFWPLQVGATLVLAEHNSHKDPYQLAAQINAHGINVLHFVPSMLAAFLSSEPQISAKLRAVVCSGEELSPAHEAQFFSQFLGVGLYNLYGPTEAAVDVSYWRCNGGGGKQIPIGKPVANTQLYVVDELGRQQPIGVAGELWIGGVQVAEGYINNQSLTAERFIENPFAPGKVYRTGDFARWTDGGVLEYLGRKDFQVKINGVRIELGEIENNIKRQAGVSNAVVIVDKHGAAQRLVAYFTRKPDASVDVKQLQQQIAQSLPAYMVPKYYVPLDDLPLNSSGKVKRSALPAPDFNARSKPERGETLSAEERKLVLLWRQHLGVDTIALDDSFFDLGGDSLMLMSLFKTLQADHPHLRSVDLFRYTSIRALAEYLGGNVEAKKRDTGRSQRMREAIGRGARRPASRTPMR